MDLPLPALMGQHQIVNAGTAVAAALEFERLGLTNAAAIERGLIDVRWPARMQPLNNGPLSALLMPGAELWLDGGHNPAGAEAIARTLGELEERAPKPVGLVVGMMGPKDAPGFFEHFRGLVRRAVTVPVPGSHDRPYDPRALAEVAAAAGLNAETADDVESRHPPPAAGGGRAAAHPDLRLALPCGASAGAAGGRAGAVELTRRRAQQFELAIVRGGYGDQLPAAVDDRDVGRRTSASFDAARSPGAPCRGPLARETAHHSIKPTM